MASRNPSGLVPTRARSTRQAARDAIPRIAIQTRQMMGIPRNPAPVSPLPRPVCAWCQGTIRARQYTERCMNCNQAVHQICVDNAHGRTCEGSCCRDLLCAMPLQGFSCPYCNVAPFRPGPLQARLRWRQVFRSREYYRYKRSISHRVGRDSRQRYAPLVPPGQVYPAPNLVNPCPDDFDFHNLEFAFFNEVHSAANQQNVNQQNVNNQQVFFLDRDEWSFFIRVCGATTRTAFLLVRNPPQAHIQTWHLSRLMFLMHEGRYSRIWKRLREMFDDRHTPIQIEPGAP